MLGSVTTEMCTSETQESGHRFLDLLKVSMDNEDCDNEQKSIWSDSALDWHIRLLLYALPLCVSIL